MALIGRISATRGALVKLRNDLELIRSGKNVLEVKRDRLVGELNNLFSELNRSGKIEDQLMEIYMHLKEAFTTLGYATVASTAASISKIKIEVIQVSIMGVVVPKITVKEKPQINSIQNISLHEVAEKMQTIIDELLHIAQIEARIERISHELMAINRKVNALEKVIIPKYEKQVRYIEDLLLDEDLEDFDRIKHVRDIIGRESHEIAENNLPHN